MTTQTLLKADIADDLTSDDYTDEIAAQITKAIAYYQSRRFWWTRTRTATFVTVASQGDYDSDDDADFSRIIKIDRMWLEKSDGDVEITRITMAEWELLTDAGSNEGEPYSYALDNETVYLVKIPDAVYNIRMQGNFEAAGPATDGEANNPWMIYAYELLRAHVTAYILRSKEQDFDRANAIDIVLGRELARHVRETRLKTERGKLRPTQF